MGFIRTLLALLLVCAQTASAHIWTDWWWDPQQSGWGVNIGQQHDTVFLAVFVYGTDGTPRWYSGAAVRDGPGNASGFPVFQGTLYESTGPWFGGFFDPARVGSRVVGTVTFSPSSPYHAQLAYSVDGVNVSRRIERFTWRHVPVAGTYYGTLLLRRDGCATGVPVGQTESIEMRVTETVDAGGVTGEASIVLIESGVQTCTLAGSYRQWGSLYQVETDALCVGTPVSLPIRLVDIYRGDEGLDGNMVLVGPNGCQVEYDFAAVAK
jgi:hypothetical protein